MVQDTLFLVPKPTFECIFLQLMHHKTPAWKKFLMQLEFQWMKPLKLSLKEREKNQTKTNNKPRPIWKACAHLCCKTSRAVLTALQPLGPHVAPHTEPHFTGAPCLCWCQLRGCTEMVTPQWPSGRFVVSVILRPNTPSDSPRKKGWV